jgi:hypothetical protein
MNFKILYFYYLAGIFFICSCKSNQEIIPYARWQGKPVVVDGNAAEWQLPLKYYVSSGKLGCTVSNDSVNLYVCVRSADQIIQTKIMKAGMTVGIDTSGKHNPQFHISYPLEKGKPEGSKEVVKEIKTEQDPSTDHHGRKKKLMAEQSTMIVTGFANTESGETVLRTLSGLNVGLNIDSINILTYEAVIPLSTIYTRKFSAKDTSNIISVSIVVNGIKMESSGSSSGGGGMSGMGGGGMSNGGMGGGSGGMGGGGGHRGGGGNSGGSSGASSGYSSLSDRDKLEIKFRLRIK